MVTWLSKQHFAVSNNQLGTNCLAEASCLLYANNEMHHTGP